MNKHIDRRSFPGRLTWAALVAAALLGGCGKVPDTIKIGVAQPLSGPLGALGQDLLNGVNLAVDELNKSGYTVDGKKVTLEVVAVDDKADSATGKAVAQQLVDAGVVAVIGHLNSGVSIDTAPIYAAKDIAQIAISTNPKFTQLGYSTTFRMVANDTLQARAIGSFAATQLGSARYAALDDGTPYGKGLADGAAEQLKAEKKEVVVRKSFDDKTTAFDALAAELKAAKVEVIVSTLNDFQALALLKALGKVDHTKVSLLGGDTIKTTDMAKGMGLVQGIYATSPVLEAKEFTTGKPFLEKYIAAYKKPPAYGGHYSYDSMYVLSAAIQKAKSADPKDITKAMHSINGYAPVIGTMTWDDKGEQRYGAVGVYELRSGNWDLRMRSDRW
ncbi:branched-chain amino acid ABC transporter substrate-binding protein [Acidovorax sp.]|uniref:branched-chain amino acid ABC transporter substrate-binding protein n=1 Tax=Acidovorax sp. TaxID=1872122 RepID=UPI002624AD8C|nr:branched-chain amino acid ABC transporter substrate-binding protein [Acidovorax sp.]